MRERDREKEGRERKRDREGKRERLRGRERERIIERTCKLHLLVVGHFIYNKQISNMATNWQYC
jgi:hypothetical protein